MGIHRSALRRQRRNDAAAQQLVNRARKTKERARRDARMLEKVKSGDPPFNPTVMSWLSRKLDKPSTKISAEDVKRLAASMQ